MSTLTKDFYRGQYNSHRRNLERLFSMFDLNETQKQEIRQVVDRMLEEQRKEYNAPEKTEEK